MIIEPSVQGALLSSHAFSVSGAAARASQLTPTQSRVVHCLRAGQLKADRFQSWHCRSDGEGAHDRADAHSERAYSDARGYRYADTDGALRLSEWCLLNATTI